MNTDGSSNRLDSKSGDSRRSDGSIIDAQSRCIQHTGSYLITLSHPVVHEADWNVPRFPLGRFQPQRWSISRNRDVIPVHTAKCDDAKQRRCELRCERRTTNDRTARVQHELSLERPTGCRQPPGRRRDHRGICRAPLEHGPRDVRPGSEIRGSNRRSCREPDARTVPGRIGIPFRAHVGRLSVPMPRSVDVRSM